MDTNSEALFKLAVTLVMGLLVGFGDESWQLGLAAAIATLLFLLR